MLTASLLVSKQPSNKDTVNSYMPLPKTNGLKSGPGLRFWRARFNVAEGDA